MEGRDVRSEDGKISYQPALDGIRALCLFAVLLFHSDFSWMSGGFLGVSTFFTLSGFLITTLLLGEYDRTTDVSLVRFWDRRLRRLAPAALVAVFAVVVTAPAWLPLPQQERLAGDAIAAATYLVNWQFVRAEYAYELIFTDPSPLQHFWSLAIEAQFYLVFPLVVGGVLRSGLGRRGLAGVLVAGVLLSVGVSFLPSVVDAGLYRVYYGSDARVAEILVGCVAAVWFAPLRADGGVPAAVRRLSPLAALGIALAWIFSSVDDAWLYRGGFALYALLSALVVVAATGPTRPFRFLATPWLVWVGRVSYGAYVYHWPVFLLLGPERTGLSPSATLAVRLGITLALAGASARWLEEPIRRGRVGVGARVPVVVGSAVAAIAVVAFALSPVPFHERFDSLTAPGGTESPGDQQTWALFGDSTALSLVVGLARFSDGIPEVRVSKGHTELGCGLITGGYLPLGGKSVEVDKCGDAPKTWASGVEANDVDVAIVLVGAWESRDWSFAEDGPRLSLGMPEFDEVVAARIGEAMDALLETGVTVVWLTTPRIGVPLKAKKARLRSIQSAAQAGRQHRFNELLREAAGDRPEVILVDLAEAVEQWPGGPFSTDLRPDRTHFGRQGSKDIVAQFLGPEILERTRP